MPWPCAGICASRTTRAPPQAPARGRRSRRPRRTVHLEHARLPAIRNLSFRRAAARTPPAPRMPLLPVRGESAKHQDQNGGELPTSGREDPSPLGEKVAPKGRMRGPSILARSRPSPVRPNDLRPRHRGGASVLREAHATASHGLTSSLPRGEGGACADAQSLPQRPRR